MPDLYEITADGRMRLNFHPGQLRAWDSTKRIVAVIAGGRSGKTIVGPPWLHREMGRKGPGDYLVVAPNYPLLDKAAVPEVQHFFEQKLRLGKLNRSPLQFQFSAEGCKRLWGTVPERPSRIIFAHAANPESLEAMSAKAAWLDEAGQAGFRLGSFEAVQQRLSIDQGRCLITTKPFNLGWMKRKIYDPWLLANRNHPEIDVINYGSADKPVFPRAELDRARRDLPAWKFRMQYLGLFERPAGLIYDCFDEPLHVRKRMPIPASWNRYLGLDFGPNNTAAVYFAEEPGTGKLWAYREYHPGVKRSTEEHVESILLREPGIPFAVGGSMSEGEWRQDFAAAGLPVSEPAVREREVGIDRMYAAIKRHEIVVFDDLEHLLEELRSYSREVDEASGEPTDRVSDANAFHLCFVAGTMIETARGQVPIEAVRTGDLILTREGYYPVAATMRSDVRKLCEIRFTDGRILVGTPDHPIWTKNNGFTRIDALRYGDTVMLSSQLTKESSWPATKPSSPTDSHGSATPIPRDGPTASISETGAYTSTASPGNSITGKFPTASTSTTKTGTPGTTTSVTSNSSRRANTSATITPGNAHRPSGITSTESAPSPQPGTLVRRAEPGTANTPSGHWDQERKSPKPATTAAEPTAPSGPIARTDSVPPSAERPPEDRVVSTTSTGTVISAATPSASTATPDAVVAPVRVLNVSEIGIGSVYNLTVAGPHEYFANGVLVSNCDACRYIVGYLRGGVREIDDLGGSDRDNRTLMSRPPEGVFIDDPGDWSERDNGCGP